MQWLQRTSLILVIAATFFQHSACAADAPQTVASDANAVSAKGSQAVNRAMTFLVEDAAKWRENRGCATCHHGIMTAWALAEAKSQGYAVPAEKLADAIKWSKDLFVPQFSKPRDPRWGYNFVSLPGIYLAWMSHTLPILSRDEMHRVAIHLARHQEADGVWTVPPLNANLKPPTWESPEQIALLALLAWEPYTPADPQTAAAARSARERAVDWLTKTKPSETTQVQSLRLLLDIRSGQSSEQLQPKINQLLGRQNADGGWSQTKDLPSDAYATGQMLWILSFAGLQADHPAVVRAISFLITTQEENGAWPMTPRPFTYKDADRKPNAVPIIYFGTAWATLGLVRFVPPTLDAATALQQSHDYVRTFGGLFQMDEADPANPVLSIKFSYEVDDDQVAEMTRLLTPVSKLKSLHFKSPAITDASATRLKALTQLRSLSLEQAAVTDVGLGALKAMSNLQELNLKGTKVTDAGVADLQKALPQVKIQR